MRTPLATPKASTVPRVEPPVDPLSPRYGPTDKLNRTADESAAASLWRDRLQIDADKKKKREAQRKRRATSWEMHLD